MLILHLTHIIQSLNIDSSLIN